MPTYTEPGEMQAWICPAESPQFDLALQKWTLLKSPRRSLLKCTAGKWIALWGLCSEILTFYLSWRANPGRWQFMESAKAALTHPPVKNNWNCHVLAIAAWILPKDNLVALQKCIPVSFSWTRVDISGKIISGFSSDRGKVLNKMNIKASKELFLWRAHMFGHQQ